MTANSVKLFSIVTRIFHGLYRQLMLETILSFLFLAGLFFFFTHSLSISSSSPSFHLFFYDRREEKRFIPWLSECKPFWQPAGKHGQNVGVTQFRLTGIFWIRLRDSFMNSLGENYWPDFPFHRGARQCNAMLLVYRYEVINWNSPPLALRKKK